MISLTTWKVGGNAKANIFSATPPVAYQNEIKSPVTTNTTDNKTEYSAKIGLLYVSDYMYAAPQDKWTLIGGGSSSTDYENAASVDWLNLGMMEWTITRAGDYSEHSYVVASNGIVGCIDVGSSAAIRPTFYLNASINYSSGDGTKTNPICISAE